MNADWRDYLKLPRETLLERLIEVTQESAGLAQELAMMQATERRAKAEGYGSSESATEAGRKRAADLNALEITATICDLGGRREALSLEADLLKLLLTDAVFGA